MISFIICSTNKSLPPLFEQNIKETVGCEYEIIVIDNSNNQYSIFEAYNEGIKRSKYEYLVFCHDDIMFRTNNVGNVLKNAFQDDKIGLVGVIGTCLLPRMPFGWWAAGKKYYVGSVIGSRKKDKVVSGYKKLDIGVCSYSDAVACDGLFLAIPKRLFDKGSLNWDNETFTGFHCYDLDICMQTIQAGYKVVVANDILIEHYSGGSPKEEFARQCAKLHMKWRGLLPVYSSVVSKEEADKVCDEVVMEYIELKPLAYRYQHIVENKMGRMVLSLMKCVRNFFDRFK
ncbi:MAG: glycosyltransferase family protein [Bacteroidales bacterium]|nr:glycosyltransferase family protein [Bacteroidales bacterium]